MTSGRTGRSDRPVKQPLQEEGKWLQLAVGYLAARDRTGLQVRHLLHRKGVSRTQIEQVVRRLSQLGYLNDRAYAERWIAGRLARRPMGRERIKAELTEKGIDPATIEDLLCNLPDERALARSALDILHRTGREMTPIQVARRLRQRGFDEETIRCMIGEDRLTHEGPGS
ncbi:MAG: recombination regulator RecX [Nitrospira sp.]|nr:recombination regulator RecX [Nitrospira sp.]MCP9462085.1 recombination regulator RecX [Nitrospira sp.]